MAGGSEHSFGIHVAKLAGMPKEIIGRAEENLTLLEESARERDEESGRIKVPSKPRLPEKKVQDGPVQLSFFQLDDPLLSQVREEIVGLDLNQLTPIDALNKLNNIQRLLTGGKEGIDLH